MANYFCAACGVKNCIKKMGEEGEYPRSCPSTAPEMEDLEGFPLHEPKKPQMRFRMRLPVPAGHLSLLRRQVNLSPGG